MELMSKAYLLTEPDGTATSDYFIICVMRIHSNTLVFLLFVVRACLEEQHPKILYDKLPVLYLIPKLRSDIIIGVCFLCFFFFLRKEP